jgi:hypothetical protein
LDSSTVPLAAVKVICNRSGGEGADVLQQTGDEDPREGLAIWTIDDGQVSLVEVVPTLDTLAEGKDAFQ